MRGLLWHSGQVLGVNPLRGNDTSNETTAVRFLVTPAATVVIAMNSVLSRSADTSRALSSPCVVPTISVTRRYFLLAGPQTSPWVGVDFVTAAAYRDG